MQIPYTPCHCCASELSVPVGEPAAAGLRRRVAAIASEYVHGQRSAARARPRPACVSPQLRTPTISPRASIETLSPSAE